MEIAVLLNLYDSYGMHKSFSIAGEHLSHDTPDFGDVIEELYITLHFKHSGPAKKKLETLYDDFHKNLSKLPKSTFYRKKRTFELAFEASFTSGLEINQFDRKHNEINPNWVKATLQAILEHLDFIKAKLKTSDDFDFDSFEKYVVDSLNSVPTDKEGLERIEKIASDRRKKTHDKQDEWGKLGIHWSDFHSDARNTMNHPYQWSSSDYFAPNGNDTGADVLAMFKEWNNKKTGNPMMFLRKLLSGWEVKLSAPYESEYTSQTYFQSVVGLAFAACKYRGVCDQQLKDLAIDAIDHYVDEVKGETEWENLEECLAKQSQSRETITTMPAA